jgi:hypothetical protein
VSRAAGPGFLLQVGDGGSPTEVFTTIAEVKDIRGPEIKRDVIDVTNQSSPGGYEEVIRSIKRTGNLTFECSFNPTDPTLDQSTGLLLNDEDDTMWSLQGFVVGFDQTAPVTNVLSANVTIKITGVPVLEPQP